MSEHMIIDEVIDICKRQGESYGASAEVTLAAGASLETFFITGSRPVVFFSRKLSYDGDGIDSYIYRDATYSGGSQTIETYSSNDIAKYTSRSYFISGATTLTPGTQTRPRIPAFGNTSNQGNGALLEAIDEPVKMLPNSIYRLVLTNRDAVSEQTVASVVGFCEPERIPGLIIQNGQFVAYSGRVF